jgi:hypothetical protein
MAGLLLGEAVFMLAVLVDLNHYNYTPSYSQREKDTIAASAGEIAGKDRVNNQLEVKTANK